jgi:Txe/YoeB family toxin of toxin-antitoxin system
LIHPLSKISPGGFSKTARSAAHRQSHKEIQRDPFTGAGKPEPLKHELKGCWSRRIDQEHRLVFYNL